MLRKIFWMLSAMNVTFLVTTLHKTGERDGMKKEIEIEQSEEDLSLKSGIKWRRTTLKRTPTNWLAERVGQRLNTRIARCFFAKALQLIAQQERFLHRMLRQRRRRRQKERKQTQRTNIIMIIRFSHTYVYRYKESLTAILQPRFLMKPTRLRCSLSI